MVKPPKAPRGHDAVSTPPPLEGDEKLVWISAFGRAVGDGCTAEVASSRGDLAVRYLRRVVIGKAGPSLYRGDAS